MMIWKWQEGRQKDTTYEKFPLWYFRIWKWGFDAYILRYQPDTYLKLHVDRVDNGKHWRLNIKLVGKASFFCHGTGIINRRFVFFRPDLYLHSLYAYTKTIRLSVGFVKFY